MPLKLIGGALNTLNSLPSQPSVAQVSLETFSLIPLTSVYLCSELMVHLYSYVGKRSPNRW